MKRVVPLIALTLLFITGCKKNDAASSGGTTPPPDQLAPNDIYTVLTGTGDSTNARCLMTFNINGQGILSISDMKGNLVTEKYMSGQVSNFQKWNIEGQVRYTYLLTSGTTTPPGISSTTIGYEVVCDSNLNPINTIKLLPYGKIDVAVQDKVDQHEFILLGDNHYIAETYYPEVVTNVPDSVPHAANTHVVACIIQEVNNGQVVWQWDPTDHPEFYGNSVESNNFTDSTTSQDFMHLNSMYVDPRDNNLICSFRNLNQIVKLDRTTGKVIWRLGGTNSDFPQTADQQFLRQHYVRLLDDRQTLLFVDNGDSTLRPYSRIVEYQVNETAKTITSFHAYTVPDVFIQFAGSVQKVGNYYFIGTGIAPRTMEVNYTTNQKVMDLQLKTGSYRALRYDF